VSGTDANDDADDDGLSNFEEYLNGTEPLKTDSDSDGISDYNELKVYKTNPTISDTDGDGLDDYSELQLNLNPLLSKTHDVLDSEDDLKPEHMILDEKNKILWLQWYNPNLKINVDKDFISKI
jgi:hypothetical protein